MALALLVCCMVLPALAQDDDVENGQVTGKFVTLPLRLQPDFGTGAPATPLQTWNGKFTYMSTPYPYTMVGKNPTTGTFNHGQDVHRSHQGRHHDGFDANDV